MTVVQIGRIPTDLSHGLAGVLAPGRRRVACDHIRGRLRPERLETVAVAIRSVLIGGVCVIAATDRPSSSTRSGSA
jgi:hypothetical protein